MCVVVCAVRRTLFRTDDVVTTTVLTCRFAGLAEAAAIFNGNTEAMPKEIAARYKLKPDDAKAWYAILHFSHEWALVGEIHV